MNARRAAYDALAAAVRDEGRAPEFHRRVVNRHRREWPALWAAIDQVLAAGPPPSVEWAELPSGELEPLPEVPESAYPPGAVPLPDPDPSSWHDVCRPPRWFGPVSS